MPTYKMVLESFYSAEVTAQECIAMLQAVHAPEHIVSNMVTLISDTIRDIAQLENRVQGGAA